MKSVAVLHCRAGHDIATYAQSSLSVLNRVLNVFLNMKRRSTNNLHQRLIMRSRDTAGLLECRVVSRSGYVTRYALSWYCKQMIVSALIPDHFRPCPANSDLYSMHSLPGKSCRWWWKSKQRLNALCRAPWRSLLTASKVSQCSVVLLKQRTVHLLQQQRQKQVQPQKVSQHHLLRSQGYSSSWIL